MKIAKRIIIVFTSIIILSIIIILLRISGFFVQFEDEMDVKNFLLDNLELNVSSITDVEEFMGKHISNSLESCSISRLSEIPNPSPHPNRIDRLIASYDDLYVNCEALSHTAWRIYPVFRYYLIDFYFDNSILQAVNVTPYFVGP